MKKLLIVPVIMLMAIPTWADGWENGHYQPLPPGTVIEFKAPPGIRAIDSVTIKEKKPCYDEVKWFNLCLCPAYREYGSGITSYVSLFPTCKEEPVKVLNRLLRQGWQLQKPYNGEREVWLKRKVCP